MSHGYIVTPNNVSIHLTAPQMRRMCSLVREAIELRRQQSVPMKDTELDLERIFNGDRVKF